MATGATIVALEPSSDLLSAVGVETEVFRGKLPVEGRCVHTDQAAWSRVRSLHAAVCFRAVDPQVQLQPVVVSAAESGLWAWLAMDRGGILLVGTDLSADLVRYRQGDPAAVADRTTANFGVFQANDPSICSIANFTVSRRANGMRIGGAGPCARRLFAMPASKRSRSCRAARPARSSSPEMTTRRIWKCTINSALHSRDCQSPISSIRSRSTAVVHLRSFRVGAASSLGCILTHLTLLIAMPSCSLYRPHGLSS